MEISGLDAFFAFVAMRIDRAMDSSAMSTFMTMLIKVFMFDSVAF